MGNVVSLCKSNEQSAERDAEETHSSRDNSGESVSQKSSELEQLLVQQIRSHFIEIRTGPTKRWPQSLFDMGEATKKKSNSAEHWHHLSVKIQSDIMRRQLEVKIVRYSLPISATILDFQTLHYTHTHSRFTALLEFVWDHLGVQVPER